MVSQGSAATSIVLIKYNDVNNTHNHTSEMWGELPTSLTIPPSER